MDQIQVDVIGTQFREARVEGLQRRFVSLVGVPELGGDEDVLARNRGARERAAHTLLVSVGRGGVDVPVAGLVDRESDGVLGLVVGGLPYSQAELRDGGSGIQRDIGSRHAFEANGNSRVSTPITRHASRHGEPIVGRAEPAGGVSELRPWDMPDLAMKPRSSNQLPVMLMSSSRRVRAPPPRWAGSSGGGSGTAVLRSCGNSRLRPPRRTARRAVCRCPGPCRP